MTADDPNGKAPTEVGATPIVRPSERPQDTPSATFTATTDDDLCAVAEGVRYALDVAGIDPTPMGIREQGPLGWDPDDEVPFDRPEPPVAIARRRVLAEQRHRDVDRQLWIGRWFVRQFGGAS